MRKCARRKTVKSRNKTPTRSHQSIPPNCDSGSPKCFAEILPRFISNLISHVPHKRIFSDRDRFIYWCYAPDAAGAGTDLRFITPLRHVTYETALLFGRGLGA